ncbi:phage head morphogenesis protein, partial [Lacrimispora sp.]|uniref:phage head morphogenesis protein n=1 Tax=Lacrimispora sp. TaxID=2719234 RepID=UPI0028AF609F
EENLPAIKEAYMEEMSRADAKNLRFDAMTSLISIIHRTFERMERQITEKEKSYGLRKILDDIEKLETKLSIKEWKKTIKATLGIDIQEDYYMGDFFKTAIGNWSSENVDLIKTIPKDTLGRMKEIVLEGYKNGRTTTSMMKQMQREYGISKSRSRLIARDQMAKLNGQIAKAQQQDAGIEEYIWWCVYDDRSRQTHKDLHKEPCRWDDPPEVAPGRYCHPGEDYQCRCIARPVFNRNLSLPVADSDVKVTIR